MQGQRSSSPEFAPHLWHDNPIYSLRLDIGDARAGVWRSELVLDIDHILAWTCTPDGHHGQFQVAPATLTFHDAGDLCLALDCGDSGGRVSLHALSIDRITREAIQSQKVCLARPIYRWRIALNWPQGGLIGFAGSGFTQVLRADPVLSDTAGLPAAYRAHCSEAKGCA